jgi:CrcB protein
MQAFGPIGSRIGPGRGQPARPRPAAAGERWDVLAAIGLGGALGSGLRYGASRWLPAPAGGFPWSTLLVNVLGCAAIGIAMVLFTQATVAHRLLRPFLGIGVLGGFTTFSGYTLDTADLVLAGQPRPALGYLGATVLAALTAVAAGTVGGHALLAARRRLAHRLGRGRRPGLARRQRRAVRGDDRR